MNIWIKPSFSLKKARIIQPGSPTKLRLLFDVTDNASMETLGCANDTLRAVYRSTTAQWDEQLERLVPQTKTVWIR